MTPDLRRYLLSVQGRLVDPPTKRKDKRLHFLALEVGWLEEVRLNVFRLSESGRRVLDTLAE